MGASWDWVTNDWKPRDYQEGGVCHMVDWASSAKSGDRIVYASPTGSGKSYMELEAQRRLGEDWWIITPRLEIARGFLEKLDHDPRDLAELVQLCERHHICTPIRFRNKLFRGDIPHIAGIIFDEGHHASAQSWQDDWVASGMPPTILLTATPYRGTSRQTAKFLKEWGEPTWIIKLDEAAERGDICIPTCEILPLVDDDCIGLTSTGEFDVEQLENATMDRVEDLARIAVQRYYAQPCNPGGWDRTTVFCLPGLASARRMLNAIAELGGSAALIDAKANDAERKYIFAALKARKVALVQISVVGEGVDLPIRRLIDAAACMSPVKWMQQIGRSTRPIGPGEARSEYICTNRNLQRHAYLMEGLIPPTKIAEAVEAFGGIGERAGYRALGLESLGRFKAVHVKLIDGNTAQFYFLVDKANGRLKEYACVLHPALATTIWATREHEQNGANRIWGNWRAIKQPEEIQGFVSQSPRPPSPKQAEWWEKSASWYGLDPDVKLTQKNFASLPLCRDLGLRLAKKPRG